MKKRALIVVLLLTVGAMLLFFHRNAVTSIDWLDKLEVTDIAQLEIIRYPRLYREVPREEYEDFVLFLHEVNWGAVRHADGSNANGEPVQLRIALRDSTVHYATKIGEAAFYIDGKYYVPDLDWLAEFDFPADAPLPENFHW